MAIYIGGAGGVMDGKRTCRFVVGTSTAGWTDADCDYLCDGVSDDAEINAAISALPTTGGEIVILDGTYNITASISTSKQNVMLSGNGTSTILKRMYTNTSSNSVVYITGSDCIVTQLAIDGNKTAYPATSNDGIRTSKNLVVRNVFIRNCAGTGIYASGAGFVKLQNNVIIGCTDGMKIEGTDHVVENNVCDSNSGYGIYGSSAERTVFVGNFCNNCACGMYIGGSYNTVTGNNCCYNTGTTTKGSGIHLNNATYCTVSGNTCCKNKATGGNGGCGILLAGATTNATISGNVCSMNSVTGTPAAGAGSGISASSSAKYCIISGNTCNGNKGGTTRAHGCGICIGSDFMSISGNMCYNNRNGILAASSDIVTVVGNTCYNNAECGIYVAELAYGMNITGNIAMRGTGLSSDYTSTQYTIRMANSTPASSGSGCVITGNMILGKNYTNEGTNNTFANNKYS